MRDNWSMDRGQSFLEAPKSSQGPQVEPAFHARRAENQINAAEACNSETRSLPDPDPWIPGLAIPEL